EGNAVFFEWKTFAGISDVARLRKAISLRLGMITLGHMMMPVVVGPAVLIQRTYGSPQATHGVKRAFAPRRLLSWMAGTPFQIIASRSVTAVYIDDCVLNPSRDGQAVYDAGGNGGSSILRELCKILRP